MMRRSIRRLLQPVARSRRTRWSNAIRAVLDNSIPTGGPSTLRLAIRLFRPLSHANCRVIRNSRWSRSGFGRSGECVADVDQAVGDDAEADPTLHAGHASVT